MPAAIRTRHPEIGRGKEVFMVPVEMITIREGWNPRTTLEVEDLKAFIKNNGNGVVVLPPIKVRMVGDTIELIAGHRRVQAVKELIAEGEPIKGLPAQVETVTNDADLLAIAISENNGVNLTPTEEALAFKRLVNYGWDVPAIATKIGKSTTHVYARLEMLEATPEVTEAHAEGSLTITDMVKIVKKAKVTGVSQEALLAHHRANKVDKRKTRHHPQTMENHIRSVLLPLVDQYGYDNVKEVFKALPEFLEGE